MRVLYVLEDAVRNRLLAALLDHLPPGAVDATVAVRGGTGPLAEQLAARGVPFHPLGIDDQRRVDALVRGLRPLLAGVDLVHAHQFYPGVATELVRRLRRPRVPSVYTRHHDLAHHDAGRRAHAWVDARTAAATDAVIAVSGAVAETMVRIEGVPAAKITVVPNGLDLSSLRPDDAAVEAWRSRLGPGPVAVAVGRLDPLKDYPSLLRAVAAARRTHPGLRLVVAGGGPDEARRAVEADVVDLHLGDAVVLAGWVDDMWSLLRAADVFVQASRTEAAPQSILEAAALDIPLAVTTPGGARELVASWYEPLAAGDPEALGARLVALLDDLPAARELAARAGADIRGRYSAERMAAGHLEVYERVLA